MIVKLGEKVQVRVKGIDEMGRVSLSMKLDEGSTLERGNFEKRSNWRRDGKKVTSGKRASGGPHFPTSRLLDEIGGKRRY